MIDLLFLQRFLGLFSSGQLQVLELPPWKAKSATYKRFRLTSGLGIEVDLLSLGATVTSIRVPDKDGVLSDVVLGFDDIETYLEHCEDSRGNCLGSILGRNVQPMDGCGCVSRFLFLHRKLAVSV